MAALLSGIVALVWAVGLVVSGKSDLPDSVAHPKEAEDILEEIFKVNDKAKVYINSTDMEEKIDLTHEIESYIMSWTNHEITRDISSELLRGRYKSRL